MTWRIHNPQPRHSMRNHMPPELTLETRVDVIFALGGTGGLRGVKAGNLCWWDCGQWSIVMWRLA